MVLEVAMQGSKGFGNEKSTEQCFSGDGSARCLRVQRHHLNTLNVLQWLSGKTGYHTSDAFPELLVLGNVDERVDVESRKCY